jgi:hypothetical protein
MGTSCTVTEMRPAIVCSYCTLFDMTSVQNTARRERRPAFAGMSWSASEIGHVTRKLSSRRKIWVTAEQYSLRCYATLK